MSWILIDVGIAASIVAFALVLGAIIFPAARCRKIDSAALAKWLREKGRPF